MSFGVPDRPNQASPGVRQRSRQSTTESACALQGKADLSTLKSEFNAEDAETAKSYLLPIGRGGTTLQASVRTFVQPDPPKAGLCFTNGTFRLDTLTVESYKNFPYWVDPRDSDLNRVCEA